MGLCMVAYDYTPDKQHGQHPMELYSDFWALWLEWRSPPRRLGFAASVTSWIGEVVSSLAPLGML